MTQNLAEATKEGAQMVLAIASILVAFIAAIAFAIWHIPDLLVWVGKEIWKKAFPPLAHRGKQLWKKAFRSR